MAPDLKKLLVRVGACCLLGVLAAVLVYHFIAGPQQARKEAVQASAVAIDAQADRKAATDAIKIIVETQAAHGRIDLVTQGNRDAILSAPGASEALGIDLQYTGLGALCLRDTYSRQPACLQLLHADPEQPAG